MNESSLEVIVKACAIAYSREDWSLCDRLACQALELSPEFRVSFSLNRKRLVALYELAVTEQSGSTKHQTLEEAASIGRGLLENTTHDTQLWSELNKAMGLIYSEIATHDGGKTETVARVVEHYEAALGWRDLPTVTRGSLATQTAVALLYLYDGQEDANIGRARRHLSEASTALPRAEYPEEAAEVADAWLTLEERERAHREGGGSA